METSSISCFSLTIIMVVPRCSLWLTDLKRSTFRNIFATMRRTSSRTDYAISDVTMATSSNITSPRNTWAIRVRGSGWNSWLNCWEEHRDCHEHDEVYVEVSWFTFILSDSTHVCCMLHQLSFYKFQGIYAFWTVVWWGIWHISFQDLRMQGLHAYS